MKYQAARGTRDLLPGEVATWRAIEQIAHDLFARYGFREIRTPMFEPTELFARGVGGSTDIVRKEMYTFQSGDDSLTLRPEMTASVVRAHIQHGLSRVPGAERLYYFGPMFRKERPQKGRQRQFHQVGVEALGSDEPYVDAETIEMLIAFLRAVFAMDGSQSPAGVPASPALAADGLPEGLRLLLNSVGCATCRPIYDAALRAWLDGPHGNDAHDAPEAPAGMSRAARLCEDCQRRMSENLLRVFDCKVPADAAVLAEAPVMRDHLCEPCRTHFAAVQADLGRLGVAFELQPRLVRGLDYYTRTAFEIVAVSGLGAQNALMGGGRYDGLMKALGGPDLPGFGWALGIERLMLLLRPASALAEGAAAEIPMVSDLFLAHLGDQARALALPLARDLRRLGLSVRLDPAARGLGAQLKRADREGARFALILGDDEIRSGTYQLRDMIAKTQEPVPADGGEPLDKRLALRIGGHSI